MDKTGRSAARLLQSDEEFDSGVELSGASTPFHMACSRGLPNVVLEELLTRGAVVNAQNAIGATPLHVAALNGHVGVATFLLQHGANLSVTTKRGQTAIDIAKDFKFDALAELLKEASA